MSAGCMRLLLSHAVRTMCRGRPGSWTSASRSPTCRGRYNILAASWGRSSFSTEDVEQTPATKKKQQGPQAHATISSVGRKIPHREIQVISEVGENLGVMHRADVIRIMDEKELKLVLLTANKEPPVYRLMRGKQIHEEQLKLREKDKAKAAPVQVKELTFSAGIASHDLTTKLKQVESWLEKKHHVRVTLRVGRAQSADNLDAALEQIVEQINMTVGFVSKPKVIKDGRAAMCILRPPSAKELLQKRKEKDAESQSITSASEDTRSKTPPVGNTDSTQESPQQ
ncbi:translation initiation factor IF-3, mitochondrial [Nothobranchius furzeri]|uniref:Translation initiation factor IF-3, mitochondrial n=1 Tax=Nothobranchius furzeri TaxID=105023 RepID=A0A1A8AHW2_NOTFU|nr:mitochondrial translational initiation factor 3 [Nothobranchius furzeri]